MYGTSGIAPQAGSKSAALLALSPTSSPLLLTEVPHFYQYFKQGRYLKQGQHT